jgi:SAM-dependent methyltransferase
VARRISGTLATFDIEEDMLARTRARAAEVGVHNIAGKLCDVPHDGFPLETASQDACLLFNILHGEEPVRLLAEAARVVRLGGVVLAIHWRYDDSTPRGPSLTIRPRPAEICRWAEETGQLAPAGPAIELPPWHYGVRLLRVDPQDSGL